MDRPHRADSRRLLVDDVQNRPHPEPSLPNRPFTKADLPLLKQKIKFLKADANTASTVFPHLNNKAEYQIANKAWEELYYTPEIFPTARTTAPHPICADLELRPDLAEHVRIKREYEEGRYEIANNPAITDKAAAIAALEKRLGPAAIGREYSKSAAQAMSVLSDLIGDPELDRAEREYKNACKTATLKRHPELQSTSMKWNPTTRPTMSSWPSQRLSRKIKALESGTEPARPAVAKSEDRQPSPSPRRGCWQRQRPDKPPGLCGNTTNFHRTGATGFAGIRREYGVKVAMLSKFRP